MVRPAVPPGRRQLSKSGASAYRVRLSRLSFMGVDREACTALRQRQGDILRRCLRLEARALGEAAGGPLGTEQEELCPTHARLRAELERKCVTRRVSLERALCFSPCFSHALITPRSIRLYRFHKVSGDYYDTSLEERRRCLGASSVAQLCKTICLTNTAGGPDTPDVDAEMPLNSRHLLVVVPYNRRFDSEKLRQCVYELNAGAVAKKRLNYRLSEDAQALTGYAHGGVTPVGSLSPLPVVLSHHIAALPSLFYLGAGDVDLKMGMLVQDFRRAYSPFVLDVTE